MGQSRANRSLRPHSLLNRERTGNFGELPVNRWHVSSNPRLFSIGYESNSLTIGTGNFCDKTGKQIRKTGNLQVLSGKPDWPSSAP